MWVYGLIINGLPLLLLAALTVVMFRMGYRNLSLAAPTALTVVGAFAFALILGFRQVSPDTMKSVFSVWPSSAIVSAILVLITLAFTGVRATNMNAEAV